ncbi:MAG: transcription antitermination factor NusB [Candidatus Scalindua sp.]|jgi:transcription antitermination factor NusB|nr:transcription antitermination factor NusB [Candidatus Scalindua sp.]MBT5304426.1 transcription antitermination factor NusB [Candidatus Scalindua sp.]MBT6225400.1 transcription antitermination factor NusB [Candidatus Scalindua sp.]MBT6561378.1 transcription antitermination factor NusB [Candidatus Scalindua sp.]MBT7212408.1 transcription antitermination factor NusB [Candidatus Scalindua sp.]
MRKRTRSREIVLQILYQLEIRGNEVIDEVDAFCIEQGKEAEVSDFAIKLAKGCIPKIEEIDQKIIDISKNWELQRMPVVDKNILRLACYELFYMDDVPPKVSINEAIDLAKKYSTEKSGFFVNGVLDKIYSINIKNDKKDQKIPTSIEGVDAFDKEDRTGADLHIHTDLSDGTMSPGQVVKEASKLNLRTIAITDHDSVDAVEIAQIVGDMEGVNVIPAIELSSYYQPADIHLLGYYIDTKNSALIEKLAELRLERVERIKKITKKLRAIGVKVEHQEVFDVSKEGSPGRMHIADVLCSKGYCANIRETFKKYLSDNGPAFVPKVALTLKDAIELIISSDGIPVLAHPGVTKRDTLIPKMVEYGLQGIEVYYPTHQPDAVKRYKRIAKKHDLVITGGSDCHGNRKPEIALGSTKISDDLVDKIKERRGNAVGALI